MDARGWADFAAGVCRGVLRRLSNFWYHLTSCIHYKIQLECTFIYELAYPIVDLFFWFVDLTLLMLLIYYDLLHEEAWPLSP
jgi:hypothetical protein